MKTVIDEIEEYVNLQKNIIAKIGNTDSPTPLRLICSKYTDICLKSNPISCLM